MKTKFLTLLGVLALTAFVAGCYSKVSGGSRMGMPFVKDKVEGRYERPMLEVFDAAKKVVVDNGTLISENSLYNQTNAVRTLTARVNQRNVWIRVEQLEPKLTAVTVQARSTAGGRDLDLTHELEKQIALKLVR